MSFVVKVLIPKISVCVKIFLDLLKYQLSENKYNKINVIFIIVKNRSLICKLNVIASVKRTCEYMNIVVCLIVILENDSGTQSTRIF